VDFAQLAERDATQRRLADLRPPPSTVPGQEGSGGAP
jgi:hypothetical protein